MSCGEQEAIVQMPRAYTTMAQQAGAVALTEDVANALAANAVVAVGVSGGKDSQACALAVHRYLEQVGHAGPRVLVHADLGVVEWKDSLPACQRLAEHLGWELVVVRRAAGDLLARWQGRWSNNVDRYRTLSCVRLILPWSTPALRFCTSELKHSVVTSALRKRYRGQHIVNVTGIRREESATRRRMPVSAPDRRLERKGLVGLTWNAIIEWSLGQVFASISDSGLALHEAYTRYGTSRVSCCYCIMSSGADLSAATKCADNHEVYVKMVELEATSSFAFQGNRWLADVAPHLLSDELRQRVVLAKEAGAAREAIEAELPKHLLYSAGWPTVMPTWQEAELIASVRRRVAALLSLDVEHTTPDTVTERYAELIRARDAKAALRGDVVLA